MRTTISFFIGLISGCLITGISFFNCKNKFSDIDVIYKTPKSEFEYSVNRLKGQNFEEMLIAFDNFKKENQIYNELVLERVTKRNYFKVCRWCQYHEMPEWNYPRSK